MHASANFPLSWCFPPSQKSLCCTVNDLAFQGENFRSVRALLQSSAPYDPSGAETLKLTSGKRHGRNCCRSLSLPGFPSNQFPDFSHQGGSRRVSCSIRLRQQNAAFRQVRIPSRPLLKVALVPITLRNRGIPSRHPSRIDNAFVAAILCGFIQTACSQQIRTFWLMGRTERQREIARRRKRKTGLAKVRARYATSKSEAEKVELLAKARRMSPFIELE